MVLARIIAVKDLGKHIYSKQAHCAYFWRTFPFSDSTSVDWIAKAKGLIFVRFHESSLPMYVYIRVYVYNKQGFLNPLSARIYTTI